jgi:F1F0 ATPase subunit 2
VSIGFFYFFSLWLSIRLLIRFKNKIRFLLLSFFVRAAVVVALFFLLARGGHWARLVAGLAGFLVIRWILIRTFKPHKRAEREE